MLPIIISIILNVAAITLSVSIIYFRTYTQEKGKNLATKEDIEEITQKVEIVKSDINLLTHKKVSYSTEKYNSLMDYNNKYAAWLNFIIYTNSGGNSEDTDSAKKAIFEKLEGLFYDFLIAEAKFDVYFIDSEFINPTNELKIKTVELSNNLHLFLTTETTTEKQINLINKLSDSDYKHEQMKQLYEKSRLNLTEYNQNKLEKYRVLAVLHNQFSRMIQTEIRNP
jgi:hypothetical protein